MSESKVQRRLAAIMAADVAGYSRLMGGDEEGTLAALKQLRRDLADFRRRFRSLENRIERILREDMFDVGDEKFLVLLFVMQPEREDRFNFREERLVRALEQLDHAFIDRLPEAIGFGDRRPRN